MLRESIAGLALVALLMCFGAPAWAATQTPTPTATPLPAPHPPFTIDGKVIELDSKTGTMIMTVQVTPTKKYDVTVIPSVNVQVCKPGFTGPADCKPGYYTTTDITKGANVRVAISQRGDEYRAQTITILK
jgi:hypothetical protein